jgi:hypothetical protein
MLRISTDTVERQTFLRLEGQVAGPWVDELRRACEPPVGNNAHPENHLVIDLVGVSFIDGPGLALFRELAARDVRFTNGSAFIAEQLKGVADVGR